MKYHINLIEAQRIQGLSESKQILWENTLTGYFRYESTATLENVVFSPNEKFVLCFFQGYEVETNTYCLLLETEKGSLIKAFGAPDSMEHCDSGAFSSDSQNVFYGSSTFFQDEKADLNLFSIAKKGGMKVIANTDGVDFLFSIPERRVILCGLGETAVLLDEQTGRAIGSCAYNDEDAFSSYSRLIVSSCRNYFLVQDRFSPSVAILFHLDAENKIRITASFGIEEDE